MAQTELSPRQIAHQSWGLLTGMHAEVIARRVAPYANLGYLLTRLQQKGAERGRLSPEDLELLEEAAAHLFNTGEITREDAFKALINHDELAAKTDYRPEQSSLYVLRAEGFRQMLDEAV